MTSLTYQQQRTQEIERLAAYICERHLEERGVWRSMPAGQKSIYRKLALAAREYLRDRERWRPIGGPLRWRRDEYKRVRR